MLVAKSKCIDSLQNECQVSLNTVESIENFVSEINNGRWDQVLPVVSRLKLPQGKLESLYELVRQKLAVFEFESSMHSNSCTCFRWCLKWLTSERWTQLGQCLDRHPSSTE